MRYMTAQEMEEAIKLHEEGWLLKDIAPKFNVCAATISRVVRGVVKPRKLFKPDCGTRIQRVPPPFEPQDFSVLPDDVLFKHVRVWDFIG